VQSGARSTHWYQSPALSCASTFSNCSNVRKSHAGNEAGAEPRLRVFNMTHDG